MLRQKNPKKRLRLARNSQCKIGELMFRKQHSLLRLKKSLNVLEQIVQTHNKEEGEDLSEEWFSDWGRDSSDEWSGGCSEDSSDNRSGDSSDEWSEDYSEKSKGGSSGDASFDSSEEACSGGFIVEWGENSSTEEERIKNEAWEKLTSENPRSENIPWILNYIEERMWGLHSRDDYPQLWWEIFRLLHKCRLHQWNLGSLYEVKYRLRMMWKTNDSVWLLDPSAWLLRKVCYIMEWLYPLTDQIEQRPEPLSEPSKLATLQDRLQEWQNHIDSLQLMCRTLKSMLKYWPDLRKVRADWIRINIAVWTFKQQRPVWWHVFEVVTFIIKYICAYPCSFGHQNRLSYKCSWIYSVNYWIQTYDAIRWLWHDWWYPGHTHRWAR